MTIYQRLRESINQLNASARAPHDTLCHSSSYLFSSFIYFIGLPSRVLDGRKVLRDSLPSSATPPPLTHTPTSPLSPSPRLPTSPQLYGSEVKGELFQLNELRLINQQLEQRLLEVAEEKRRLEVELQRHKATLEKVCTQSFYTL